jgi:hypothetical protein
LGALLLFMEKNGKEEFEVVIMIAQQQTEEMHGSDRVLT